MSSLPKPLLYLRTIAIASLGGLIGYVFQLPLGWLIGAMLVTVPCAMAGIRVPMSWPLRSLMIGTIGVMAGGSFTPETVARAGEWTYSLAGVAGYCLVTTAIGVFICLRLGRQDRVTATFSAAPGGLSEILVLGPIYGADIRALSLVHGMRLLVILIFVPMVVVWIGSGGNAQQAIDRSIDLSLAMPLKDLLVLAACLAVGILGGRLIRLPAPQLTGPLLLSAAAHYTGLTTVDPPQLVIILAQIVIGASVAQFFVNTSWKDILNGLLVGGGLTGINLALASLLALGFEHWLGIPFMEALLALIPGGLPEMSLASIALGLDAAFVSLHHVFRVLLVLLLLPLLVRFWAGKRKPA